MEFMLCKGEVLNQDTLSSWVGFVHAPPARSSWSVTDSADLCGALWVFKVKVGNAMPIIGVERGDIPRKMC